MQAVMVSAVSNLIASEHPSTVYKAAKHASDTAFRKNWLDMATLRNEDPSQTTYRLRGLIAKYQKLSPAVRPGLALLHLLRIRALTVALCSLNSVFSSYLDEDVVCHPGWMDLDANIIKIAGKFIDAFWAFTQGKESKGDALFDEADEVFGRFRYALWCTKNAVCVSSTVIHNFAGDISQ